MEMSKIERNIETLDRQIGRLDNRVDRINADRAAADDALAKRVEAIEQRLKKWEGAPLCKGVISCCEGMERRIERLEGNR